MHTPAIPNEALRQLQSVAKRASEIEDILLHRLPNQRKLVAAAAASNKWLAISVWKHEIERLNAGQRQASMSLKQYCHRVLSQAEDLTKLLFELDLVLSEGDPTIRQERKALVGKIQELLLVADTMALESGRLAQFVHSCLAQKVKLLALAAPEDDATTETSSTLGDDYELVEWMAEHGIHDIADAGDRHAEADVDASTREVPCHADALEAPNAVDEGAPTTERRENDTDGNSMQQLVDPVDPEEDTSEADAFAMSTKNDVEEALRNEPQESEDEAPRQEEPIARASQLASIQGDASTTGSVDEPATKKPHMIHVHINGRTYVTPAQGDTTHIYINDQEPSMEPSYETIAPAAYCIPHMRPSLAVPRTRPMLFRPAVVRPQPVLVSSPYIPFGRFFW